jgi:hypothetical protein
VTVPVTVLPFVGCSCAWALGPGAPMLAQPATSAATAAAMIGFFLTGLLILVKWNGPARGRPVWRRR